MKDLRECGEVGPSENGEPIFSCLFCGDRLNAMELLIDHINTLHKEKIVFEQDALKKRPRRKRKSELPVSEWIHLEKQKIKRSERIISRKAKHQSSINEDIKTKILNEKENSELEFKSSDRLSELENKECNLQINEYRKSKRKISEVKIESTEIETQVVPKFSRKKRKRKIKKDNFTVVPIESEEDIPIKIRLKRKGREISVQNKKNSENSKDKINSNFIKNELTSNTKEEEFNHSIIENEILSIPMELSKESKNIFELNPITNIELKPLDINTCENLTEDCQDKIIEPIKNEEDELNIVRDQLKDEIDNEPKMEENVNEFQQVVEEDKKNGETENGNLEDGFFEDLPFNFENNNYSYSEDTDSEYYQDFETNSPTDSDSEKISIIKQKLRKTKGQVNGNMKGEFFSSVNSKGKKIIRLNKLKVDGQKVERTGIRLNKLKIDNQKKERTGKKKRRRLKCTAKTRKMNEFGEYVCDLCGNTYKKATSLSRHRSDCRRGKIVTPRVRVRKENGMFPCSYENCDGEFENVEEVFKHEREIHGKKKYARPQIRNKNEFGEYVCDICGNVYKKGTSLSRHRALCREGVVVVPKRKKRNRMRNEKGMYPCAFNSCGFEFDKVEDVMVHEKEVHKGGKKKKIGRMCEVCGKWLTSACSFKSHMLRHSGERNYKCDQCDGAFYDKYALTLHKKIHTDVKEYECEYCDKNFARSIEMRKHVRYVHLNQRPDPVMCDLCGKYFHWKFDLKSHMRRHYNVKTIRCEFAECEQMFANRSDLKKHLITHNPDYKPWQCEICSNSFSRKSTLVKHQKLHTGTKDYTCSICGKAFAQSPGLYMHMKSHGFNLKPEGAGRYERVSQIAYRQMDPNRLSSLNFKQNEINNINRDNMQINTQREDEIMSLNQEGNSHFEHSISELQRDEISLSKNHENYDSLSKNLENQYEISTNRITTLRIEPLQGDLGSNLINNPTITIGNEIQINLSRSLQIELGQISH